MIKETVNMCLHSNLFGIRNTIDSDLFLCRNNIFDNYYLILFEIEPYNTWGNYTADLGSVYRYKINRYNARFYNILDSNNIIVGILCLNYCKYSSYEIFGKHTEPDLFSSLIYRKIDNSKVIGYALTGHSTLQDNLKPDVLRNNSILT